VADPEGAQGAGAPKRRSSIPWSKNATKNYSVYSSGVAFWLFQRNANHL